MQHDDDQLQQRNSPAGKLLRFYALDESSGRQTSSNYERLTQSIIGPNTDATKKDRTTVLGLTLIQDASSFVGCSPQPCFQGAHAANLTRRTPLCRSGTSSVITPVRSMTQLSLTSCWMSKILNLPVISPTALFSSLLLGQGLLLENPLSVRAMSSTDVPSNEWTRSGLRPIALPRTTDCSTAAR